MNLEARLRYLFTPGDWGGRFEPSDRLLDSPLFSGWPSLGHKLVCRIYSHNDSSYGYCCWCDYIFPDWSNRVSEDEIRAYYRGLREGIRRYAVYKDGELFVGVLQKPINDVYAEIMEDEETDLLAYREDA